MTQSVPGLVAPGNIDIHSRPVVQNPDGSISTVRSISINVDGREVLIPTVSDDGRILSDTDAIDLFRRTGRHLGMFRDVNTANAYAARLHQNQATEYGGRRKGMAQQPSGFDFSALEQTAKDTPSASAGFDFSATPLHSAQAQPAQPAAAPQSKSALGRAVDFLLTPLVSDETARRFVGATGALPDVPVLGTVWNAIKAAPSLMTGQIVPSLSAPEDPIVQAGADVIERAVTEPRTIPAMVKGAYQGVMEGGARLTDPVDLAAALTGGATRTIRPALVRALRALPEAERALVAMRASGNLPEVKQIIGEIQSLRSQADISRKLLQWVRGVDVASGGAVAAHGAERLMDAKTLPEAGAGLAELGFGALGMRTAAHVPELAAREGLHVGELPPARGFTVTPEGAAVPAGQPVPDTVVPDASFVRAVPAELARRETRGYLPAGARPVTESGVVLPPGTDVIPAGQPDPSFVRGVPAEYARREPAGLLPEQSAAANEFVMLPDGSIIRRADLAAIQSRGTLPPNTPQSAGAGATEAAATKGKGKRSRVQEAASQLAAIMDRHASGEPIYSSDPHAQSIKGVPLDNAEQHEVRRMLAEMESIPFTKHTFNDPGVGKGGSLEIVPGAAGAPVYQDVLDIHGGSASRAAIQEAMQKVLAGERTAYGPAIREIARQRMSGHRRAMLPPEAGDLPQSGHMTDEDFNDFSRYVDRLSGEHASGYEGVEREPGQEGRISTEAAAHIGGAVAGGLTGAASGDDTESRIKRGLIGATVGAMVPSMVGRPGARIPAELAGLGERTAAAGITPEVVDARISQLEPRTANRPIYPDPIEATYQRVLRQGGRKLATETGMIDPAVASHVGGAVAGGLTGAASGEDTEDRIKRGLIGAAIGGVAPALIRGGNGRLVRAAGTPAEVRAASGAAPVVSAEGAVLPTSARPAPTPRQPLRDPMAGVDTFIEHFPEELRGGIRDIIESNHGFQAQRRGTISEEMTAGLAERVKVDLSRRLKPGTAVNAESVRAFTDQLATSQQKIQTLTERVNSGRATDAEVVALEQARAEASTLAASIMGARSEAGRALAQFKVLARVLDTGNSRLIQQTANGLRGEAAEFAAKFAELPSDPMERYRWLQAQERPSRMDRARSYYYANILSGLKTHERNILGNVSNAIANVAAAPVAAGVDAIRSGLTGKPRTILFSELPHQAAGALAGIERGFSEAMFSLKNGVSRAQLSGAMTAAEAGRLDIPRIEFKGGGANPFNWPGRALDGADQFFRAVAFDSELSGLAFAQAKREGLSGQALTDRMAALKTGVDETAQRVQQQAQDFARKAVFQEPGGNFVKGLQLLSQKVPGVSFVIPFIKTPAAIFRQGAAFSPAGFAMKGARAGGREGAQNIAKATMGSVAAGYLAYLAATDRLSGSGPTNPAERAQLMESGWRPDSVKIGDKWVSYSLFQPVSVQASAIANAFDAWRAAGANASAADKVYASVMRSIRSGLNQSFLSGLSDLVQAVEDSDTTLGAAQKYAGRTAGGFVPFAGAVRTVQQAMDAKVRQPTNTAEAVKAGIPGLSESVPARLDRFGREITREGGPLRRASDPFNTSSKVDDPVLQLIDRLGITVGRSSDQFNVPGAAKGTKLPDDQARALEIARGQARYAALARLLQQPAFETRSLEVQQRYAEKVLRTATERVTNAARGLARRRQAITVDALTPAIHAGHVE
jgi:hypothetical protein